MSQDLSSAAFVIGALGVNKPDAKKMFASIERVEDVTIK